MHYVMDLVVEAGYIVNIIDNGNKEMKHGDLDYSIYGEVVPKKGGQGEFSFKINGQEYYAKDEFEKYIVSMRINKDRNVTVKKENPAGTAPEEVQNPEFTLWRKMEKKDICITLLRVEVCF